MRTEKENFHSKKLWRRQKKKKKKESLGPMIYIVKNFKQLFHYAEEAVEKSYNSDTNEENTFSFEEFEPMWF